MSQEEENRELEAAKFLAMLSGETAVSEPEDVDFNSYVSRSNKTMIRDIDKKLNEKVSDGELGAKDLISLKGELFKQVRIIEGENYSEDPSKFIPMNVTINIQNNNA